jgi:hypothetical protein
VIKKPVNINTRWWWHELPLIKKIRLEGTETTTARELLASVVAEALVTAPSYFACEKQVYGATEEFEYTPSELATNAVVRSRYFLVEMFEAQILNYN